MGISFFTIILAVFAVLALIGVPVALFFAVRYFIRYHARLMKEKSSRQEEMDKMNIEDL